MSEAPRDEIIPLWPTWIGRLQLPDAGERNRALFDLAAQRPLDGNLFEADQPAVAWLRDWISVAIGQWFEKMNVQPAPRWRLAGRIEALGFGQYRELGNEPGAYLAGFYFVNTPKPPELEHLRSDCFASHISLLDPRVGFNALTLDRDPSYPPEIMFAPVAGILMLWPGYLRSCSRVHLAHEPSVRVALRIELAGKPKAEPQ
jgi:hypothetical protein